MMKDENDNMNQVHMNSPRRASDSSFILHPPSFSRRDFFNFAATGIGGVALASLLAQDGVAAPVPGEAGDPPPHHAAKAKRVIHIVLCGGLSQVDSFDYKPELVKQHGKPLGGSEKPDVF